MSGLLLGDDKKKVSKEKVDLDIVENKKEK
jgi:hypothetical protein